VLILYIPNRQELLVFYWSSSITGFNFDMAGTEVWLAVPVMIVLSIVQDGKFIIVQIFYDFI
jgi:hypothetical protein